MICGGRNTPGGDKMTLTDTEETQFDKLIRPIALDQKALRMKKYIQHGKVTTYSHSLRVAKTAFALNRSLHAGCDERRLVRAAFLHDYFLYDWHTHGDKLHGYHHPEIAAENAARDFGLDQEGAEHNPDAYVAAYFVPCAGFQRSLDCDDRGQALRGRRNIGALKMYKITEGYLPFLSGRTYYRIVEPQQGADPTKAPIILLHGGPGSRTMDAQSFRMIRSGAENRTLTDSRSSGRWIHGCGS